MDARADADEAAAAPRTAGTGPPGEGDAGPDPAALFRPLADARRVALAVSGGGDSTAMMVLYADWRAAHPDAPPAVVLTVDHGLRAEAADECAAVAGQARALGLPCRILRVAEHPPARGSLQAWARSARYRLLAAAACEADADVLATAHTRTDVAETFLIRLKRGSGLAGLAAMRGETRIGAVRLVRPLLGLSRARLRAFLAGRGVAFHDDPANEDPRHARSRVRRLLSRLEAEGLSAATLAATAERLARASLVVEDAVGALADAAAAVDPSGAVLLATSGPAWAAARPEVRLRLLARALAFVGGRDYGPRLAALERLEAAVSGGLAGRRTLAGCAVSPTAEGVVLHREPGRRGLATATVSAGRAIVWDGRFRVELEAGAVGEARVVAIGTLPRALAADAHAALARAQAGAALAHCPDTVRRAARDAAPAVVGNDRVLAVAGAGGAGVAIALARPPVFAHPDGLPFAPVSAYPDTRRADGRAGRRTGPDGESER